MEIKEIRRIGKPFLALGLAMLVSGMTGCNQSIQNGEQESAQQPVTGTNGPSAEQPAMSLGDGQKLEGDKLKEFLKLHAENKSQLPEVKPAPTSEAGPLLKTAAACDVNFNSYSGLNNMADKAYTYYATAPWYSQTCGTNTAYAVPTTYKFYYLTPELTNTCIGTYGKWGTKSGTSCIDQKSAAYFSRYAGNGSTTDGSLGIKVSLHNGSTYRNFNINSMSVISGTVTVYAYREGIGWWYWGPLAGPNWFYWTNGQNVRDMTVHASNNASVYTVDNINITGL